MVGPRLAQGSRWVAEVTPHIPVFLTAGPAASGLSEAGEGSMALEKGVNTNQALPSLSQVGPHLCPR